MHLLTSRARRWALAAAGLCAIYAGLALPERGTDGARRAPIAGEPFVWGRNALWDTLEQRFRTAAALGCASLRDSMDAGFRRGERYAGALGRDSVGHTAAVLDSIERNTFSLAALVAACPERLPAYADLVTRTRSSVKRQSEHWDLADGKTRLYRLLWGGRARSRRSCCRATSAPCRR